MSKKEEKVYEYSKRLSHGNPMIKNFTECAFMVGWDEALKNILVDASKELPEYDIDVWVINEEGEQFYCHRSKNKRVKAYKDEWCNYAGSDIIAWIRPISFEEILKLNKDVLKRLKNK